MYVQVPLKVRNGIRSLGAGVTGACESPTFAGILTLSSFTAVSALNCWASSPVPEMIIFKA